MKRLIALVILVIFVGLIAIFGNVASEKYYNYNKQELQKCLSNEDSEIHIQNIKKKFNKNKNFLYIYGNRKTINNIQNKIEALETSIKFNNNNDIELNSKELLELIDSFCSEEQLKIENFY